MEVAEIGIKKGNQSVRPQQQPGELKKYQHRDARLIEESEKIVEEIQQKMSYTVRKFLEKQLDIGSAKSKLASYRLDYGWSYGKRKIYENSELDRKKMELEKLTFTHGGCRDKKAVLYFSSGREPELNIHIYWLEHDCLMKWRLNSISELNKTRKKLMEVAMEREQLFHDAPVKGSVWSSLPSTKKLQKQIQALERSKEKRIKVISERRKKIDSYKREIRKAENDIKSLRKTMEGFARKKQKALQTLSLLRDSS